jgi:dipeptidase D
MSDSLDGLKPSSLWKHFDAFLKIPHGSGHEKALADYVLAKAKAWKLPAKKDASGNVVIRKPASPGKEAAPGVILQ